MQGGRERHTYSLISTSKIINNNNDHNNSNNNNDIIIIICLCWLLEAIIGRGRGGAGAGGRAQLPPQAPQACSSFIFRTAPISLAGALRVR